jgi:hypothetical protein
MLKINYFNIKENIDIIIYKTYNLCVCFVNVFSYTKRKLLSLNRRYNNKYQGKCFIVGTGPSISSLSNNEIKIINENYSFGVNSLYKTEVGRKILPNFYVLMDRDYVNENREVFLDISDVYSNRVPKFITDYRFAENEQLKYFKNTIYISPKKYPISKVEIDLCKDISGVNNVVSYSILVAIYMGFKEIYLVGCDYNIFCKNNESNYYDNNNEFTRKNLGYYLKYFWLTTEFHYMIQNKSKNLGVKIVNVTKNSLLDAYQFGELDKLKTTRDIEE